MDIRYHGYTKLWLYQIMDISNYGYTNQIIDIPNYGYTKLRTCQIMDIPNYGYTKLWIYQIMDIANQGYTKPIIGEPAKPATTHTRWSPKTYLSRI